MAKQKQTPAISTANLSTGELQRRKELHQRFNQEINSLEGKSIHLVTFKLGSEQFAIEISKINRVIYTPKISRLPKTPAYIPGIAQVKNTSLIILDLSSKLELSTQEKQQQYPYTILVSSGRFSIGILVEEVPANMKVDGAAIQAAGLDLAGTPEDETYIKGIINQGGDTFYFIDIDELIEGDRMEARAMIDG